MFRKRIDDASKNRLNLLLVFCLFYFPALCFASSEGAHQGHLSDLIAPFINFLLLFGFLFWKLKNPLSHYFFQLSEQTEDQYSKAQTKAKESQLKLENVQKKMKNVEQECKEIKQRVSVDLDVFMKQYMNEASVKIEKLKKEYANKLETEKNKQIQQINKQFVDAIVSIAKEKIGEDSQAKEKITKNMLEVIRI